MFLRVVEELVGPGDRLAQGVVALHADQGVQQIEDGVVVGAAGADEARASHARYFADRAGDLLARWHGARQRETYAWFTREFANLRTAFRWCARNGDLDAAATLATHAAFLGVWVERYEAVAWAEEMIEPARAVEHRRLCSCTCWQPSATRPDGSTTLSATLRPASA